MGLSSVSIGHANKYINNQVKKELDKGLNFNRPSILEFQVAKEFLNLVPNHQMIKFAKMDQLLLRLQLNLQELIRIET